MALAIRLDADLATALRNGSKRQHRFPCTDTISSIATVGDVIEFIEVGAYGKTSPISTARSKGLPWDINPDVWVVEFEVAQ